MNNPIMYVDPDGNSPKTTLGIILGVVLVVFAVGATIATGGAFATLGVGFIVGASASFIGQGIGNVISGQNFFHDMSVGSIIMAGLAGAAFVTGVGGFWGAVAIGSISNAGASALENKSWTNIGFSAIVGGDSSWC